MLCCNITLRDKKMYSVLNVNSWLHGQIPLFTSQEKKEMYSRGIKYIFIDETEALTMLNLASKNGLHFL